MLELWIQSLTKVKLWDLEIQQDHGYTSRHPITVVFTYLIQIFPSPKRFVTNASRLPTNNSISPLENLQQSPPKEVVTEIWDSFDGKICLLFHEWWYSIYPTRKTKTNVIWIVDLQWIGRKAVNVSIVSIDNQRNRCLANLILNGQVQEKSPFLLHKSTLPFRVESMKGWKSWTSFRKSRGHGYQKTWRVDRVWLSSIFTAGFRVWFHHLWKYSSLIWIIYPG